MTEQQSYQVLQRHGSAELRRYDACTVADVIVEGPEEKAGNAAFRPLVSYISGGNVASRKLAMTAPVVQEPAGEHLAMTAPVLQQASGDRLWTVSFVLPGSRPLSEYPSPTDLRVTLRHVPQHTAAALQWSGRWTHASGRKDPRAGTNDGRSRLGPRRGTPMGPLRPTVETGVRQAQRDRDPRTRVRLTP